MITPSTTEPLPSTDHRLPVTVFSGFLGSGKTTIINNFLKNANGRRLAILVNDMSEINIDADLIRSVADQAGAQMVELQNGCICCTLRSELIEQIKNLALSRKFDHLVIESTGISEPRPVAEIFSLPVDSATQDVNISDIAYVNSMVTVVDPKRFFEIYLSEEELKEDASGNTEYLSELLVDQIEYADTLIISKTDCVSADAVIEMHSFFKKINPTSRVIELSHGALNPDSILDTQSFSKSDFPFIPDTTTGMAAEEIDRFDIQSMVWRARRPIDPRKMWSLFEGIDSFGQILRCKGFLWVCTVPDKIVAWQQAGTILRHEIRGMWWRNTPRPHWPKDPKALSWIDGKWDPDVGDCRQELVLIGRHLNTARLTEALDQCLLTMTEYMAGPLSWRDFQDPFDFRRDDPSYLKA